MKFHPLQPHPDHPPPADLRVMAGVLRQAGGLTLIYRIDGPLARLCLPPDEAPTARDGLWQHTCLEAFISEGNTPAYREFNFSPGGPWAAYRFTACRERDTAWHPAAAPALDRTEHADALILTVQLPAALLPPDSPAHLGLTAVLESATDQRLSYWALHHAGQQPDFHRRDSFVLPLP